MYCSPVSWLRHRSTIPGTSLNVNRLYSWGFSSQRGFWCFHHTKGRSAIKHYWERLRHYRDCHNFKYEWGEREPCTALWFGLVISLFFCGSTEKVHVCIFQNRPRSASLTTDRHFWHINSSIQPLLRVPLWLQLWVRVQASVTPPLIITMTLAFQWAGKHFAE